jgi:ADP-ribose pyrophosphatase
MEPDEARTVYRGTLFSVTVERWGDHEREIVEHPGSVAIVAVDGEDRVVLVRQPREPARKHLLEVPAGTLDRGEDPIAAARRELQEETGLHGGRWRQGPSIYPSPGFLREVVHLFLAEGLEEGESAPEEDEELELVRWPVAELGDRLAELEDAKTLVGLLLYLHGR